MLLRIGLWVIWQILFPFDDSFDGRDLVLLNRGFLLLLSFPHRLKVFLVLLGRLGECFIAAKRLEGHRLELHFLCDSIRFIIITRQSFAKTKRILPLLISSSAAAGLAPPVAAALDVSDSSIPISFSFSSRCLLADIKARGSDRASIKPTTMAVNQS